VVHFRMPASQRLTPDGNKIPQAELKEMRVTFDPSSQPLHSIENVGSVLNQGYRIEIKPTTKVAVAKSAR
jgi:hypothetical protein